MCRRRISLQFDLLNGTFARFANTPFTANEAFDSVQDFFESPFGEIQKTLVVMFFSLISLSELSLLGLDGLIRFLKQSQQS